MVALWGSFRERSWDLYGFVGFHHLHPALIDRAGSNVFASRPSLLRSFLLSPSHATPTGGCSHVVCHGTMLRSHEPKGGGTRFNQLAGFHHLCWGGPYHHIRVPNWYSCWVRPCDATRRPTVVETENAWPCRAWPDSIRI